VICLTGWRLRPFDIASATAASNCVTTRLRLLVSHRIGHLRERRTLVARDAEKIDERLAFTRHASIVHAVEADLPELRITQGVHP
jgi:hypothetical protein